MTVVENVSFKNLVILYLIISANFLPQTFSCTLQKMLNEHMYIKHIAGWLTLLFFVLLSSSKTPSKDGTLFFKTLLQSFLLYMMFVFSTKMNKIFTYIFLSFALMYFLLQNYKESLDESVFLDRINQLALTNDILALLAMLFLFIGVLQYSNKKMKEYGGDFNLLTFFFGKTVCKTA